MSALAVLTLAATVIRLQGFQQWWLNPDEAMYSRMATAPRAIALEMIAENAHPPLFYWILRGLAVFSQDPSWLRLSALVPGVALVPCSYLLGRRFGGNRMTGLLTALLITVAPGPVGLSQVMRPYMLQITCLALGLWGLMSYLQSNRRAGLLVYTIATGSALLLHYSTFVVLGGVGACLVATLAARKLSPRRWLHVGMAQVPLAAGAVYLYVSHVGPRLVGSAVQANARENWLREQFGGHLPEAAARLLDAARFGFGGGLSLVVVGLAILGIVFLAVHRRVQAASLMIGVALTAEILALTGIYPLGPSRHSLYLVLIFAPAFAYGIAALPVGRPVLRATAGALLVLALHEAAPWTSSEGKAFASERVIRRTEAEAVRNWILSEDRDRRLFITDRQTSFLLWALLGKAEAPRGARGGFEVFGAGGRDFVKSSTWGWSLDWRARRTVGPLHLGAILHALNEDPDWRPRLDDAELWIVQGGWGDLMIRGAFHVEPPILLDAVGGRDFGAVQLNGPAYVRFLQGY